VFLVRILKIYTSGIRIRTNQECFGDQPNRPCFSHRDFRVYHIFLKLKFVRVLSCKKNAGRGRVDDDDADA
jgi:hypothetical protein